MQTASSSETPGFTLGANRRNTRQQVGKASVYICVAVEGTEQRKQMLLFVSYLPFLPESQ